MIGFLICLFLTMLMICLTSMGIINFGLIMCVLPMVIYVILMSMIFIIYVTYIGTIILFSEYLEKSVKKEDIEKIIEDDK